MREVNMNLYVSRRSRAEKIAGCLDRPFDVIGVELDQVEEHGEPGRPETRLVRGIPDDGANDLHRLHIPMEVTWDPIP